ncbi:glycosyltransferase [bacterium]|nr:MAG: glycosyltransferase [bacterium]
MSPARKTRFPSLEHLLQLSDDCGVIQHATYDVPNRETGYCVDDVARAFIVAARLYLEDGRREARGLAARMLSFLHNAQLPDGRFHNFMGYDRRWLDQAGGEDAFGRALWALGWGLSVPSERGWHRLCTQMLESALPHVPELYHLRPCAYAALGLAQAARSELAAGHAQILEMLGLLTERLLAARARYDSQWAWFETTLTYANARLPQALLSAGTVLAHARATAVGLETLAFLETLTIERGVFIPVGNEGWCTRGGHRALYAQQPIEAGAMVEAELAAHAVSGLDHHRRTAGVAFDWFFGHNSGSAIMVQGGGCRDGLERGGPNHNMGAESTLCYLMAAIAMAAHPVAEQRGVRR